MFSKPVGIMDETDRQNELNRMRRALERSRQQRLPQDLVEPGGERPVAAQSDISSFENEGRVDPVSDPSQLISEASTSDQTGLPLAFDPFSIKAEPATNSASAISEISGLEPDQSAGARPSAPSPVYGAMVSSESDQVAVSDPKPQMAVSMVASGPDPTLSAQLDIEQGVGPRSAPAARPRRMVNATLDNPESVRPDISASLPEGNIGTGSPDVMSSDQAQALAVSTSVGSGGAGSGGSGAAAPPRVRNGRKSPWRRKLFWTGGGVVALLLLVLFVLPLLLPTGTITREVERQVRSATGFDLAVRGPVSINLLPSPRLRLDDVTVSTGGGTQGRGDEGVYTPLFQTDSLRFGINLAAIFTGQVHLQSLTLVKPTLTLTVDEAGQRNWSPSDPLNERATGTSSVDGELSDTGDAFAALERLQVDEINIRNGRLIYTDLGSLTSHAFEKLHLSTALSSLDNPLQINGSFVYQEEPLNIFALLGAPRAAISNERSPIEFRASGRPIDLEVSGNLDFGSGPAFDGLAIIDVPSTPALATWFGATWPENAQTPKTLKATAQVSANPVIVDLSNLALTMGDESLQGDVRLDLSKTTPTIGGRVFSERIDIPLLAAALGLSTPHGIELDGFLTIDLQFATFGANLDEIAASLNARGSLGLRDGSATGLGLGNLLGDPQADQVTNITANIIVNTLDTPIGLLGQADWRGEQFDITGQFGAGQMLSNGMGSAQLGINSSRISGGIDGTLTQTGDFDGNVTLQTGSLRAFLAWLNMPLASNATNQRSLGPFSYSGTVSLSPNAINFSESRFALDNSRGAGSGAFIYADKPTLSANLAMQTLDLTPYVIADASLSSSTGANSALPGLDISGSDNQNGGWNTAPLDLSALNDLDAQLELSAAEIIYDQVRTGQTAMSVNLSGGIITADLNQMQLYDGRGAGRVRLDASNANPTLAANFDLASLNALSFLNDAIGLDRIAGTGDFSLSLQASGNSTLALVQSLDGESRMIFRNGALRGINIPRMVRTLSARTLVGWQTNETQQTDFSEFSAAFEIVNGLARTRDQNIRFVGPLVRATGAGTIDLPAKTLELRFDPRIVASLQGQDSTRQDLRGLGVPIVVEGTWSNPRIYPDIAGILQNPDAAFRQLQQFGGGLAALTDDGNALRDQVRERTGIDLNSVVQDGRIDRNTALNQGADLIGRLVGGQTLGTNTLPRDAGGNAFDGVAQPAGGPPIPRPDPRGSLVRVTTPSNAAPRFMTPAEAQRVTGGRAIVSGSGQTAQPPAAAPPPAIAPQPSNGGPIDLLNPGGRDVQPVAPGSGNPRGPSPNPIEGVLRGLFGR